MLQFDPIDDPSLLDLLFNSNLSNQEIAHELGVTTGEVSRRIKDLGLGWVRRSRGFASRGQASLAHLLRKLLPGEEIICEHPIGERLRLDVYCPKYQIALEYHGRQHFEYVEFFHTDAAGFDEHYKRDLRKAEICAEKGIALVVFRYNDLLSEETVYTRILHALSTNDPAPKEERSSITDSPVYQAYRERQREYQRQAYRRLKRQRNGTRRK